MFTCGFIKNTTFTTFKPSLLSSFAQHFSDTNTLLRLRKKNGFNLKTFAVCYVNQWSIPNIWLFIYFLNFILLMWVSFSLCQVCLADNVGVSFLHQLPTCVFSFVSLFYQTNPWSFTNSTLLYNCTCLPLVCCAL